MNGELVKVTTEDRFELDGYLAMPEDAKVAVLHIPGSEGTFYENYFIMPIARRLYNSACAFLSVNTRGYGTFSNLRRLTEKGVEWVEIGAAREVFEESVYDIDAWIRFLQERGIRSVFLEGHSWGCHKAAYYYSVRGGGSLGGLILLSPSDWIGYQVVFFADRYESDKKLAQSMVAEGRGKELMPKEAFVYPIDANAYHINLGIGTKSGIFDYYDQNAKFDLVESIRVPVLATFGSENEVLVKEPQVCVDILRRHSKNIPMFEGHIVKGAPHNYAGHEEELAEIVGSWVDKARQWKK